MGSLDDAIREHLELKRRLGASDDEIKEKESEAFGKGNRPAQAQPEEPAIAEPAAALEAGSHDEPFTDPDLAAAEPAANGQHSTADEIFEPDEVPADESLTVRDERPPHGDVAEETPEEDVLEETPEFLEETPEHDRLWFEQRPPKDFDFD